jgi:hypothetical protein
MGDNGHSDDCCGDHDGGGTKVEVDLCELIMCGARLGRKCKCKECCAMVQASGGATQQVSDATTLAIMDQIDFVDGVTVKSTTEFEVECDGVYLVVAAPQVGEAGLTTEIANFRCWIIVNGVGVPNSNVLMNLEADGGTKDVIVSQGVMVLKKGDVVSVGVRASEPVGVFLEAIQPSPDEPLVPSIIFTMAWQCPAPKPPRA